MADPRPAPVPDELLRKIDPYWRAANYLSVGQIRVPLDGRFTSHASFGRMLFETV